MGKLFTKKVLKFGALALVVMGLVAGLAVPGLAAPKAEGKNSDRPVHPNLLRGTVAGIDTQNKASFDIKMGEKQLTIKVDDNTKYFIVMLPSPRPNVEKEDRDGKGPRNIERGQGPKNGKSNREEALERAREKAEELREKLAEKELGKLHRFAKPATFDDLAVGQHVVVQVMPNELLAKQVFIIKKAPETGKVSGTITAVGDGTIQITGQDGTVVDLKWDASTRFILQGLISVQTGQHASAAFNPETKLAKIVHVKPTPPTPTVSNSTTST